MKKYTREYEITAEERADNILALSFASSAPYLRENKKLGKYNEVLKIDENSVDFTRLVDNRAPLLLNHDTERQIGVVNYAWLQDEKLYCEVKFSDSEEAQQILKDIKSGIRRNTSIGYGVIDYTFEQSNTGDIPTMFVTKWLPYEVSIVSIPADPNVGYQRSLDTEDNEDETTKEQEENQEEQTEKSCAENPDKKDCDEQTEEQETEEVKEQEVQEQKNQEVDNQHNDAVENDESAVDDSEEIRSLGELVNMQQLAEEYITNKRSYDEFKTAVKANKEKENNLNVKKDKDMEKFSLRKAILNAVGKLSDEEAAFERGVIEENKRRFNITDADIVISNKEIRAFDGTEAINQTVYQPGLYTPNLRPAVTVDAVGTKKVAVTGPSISFSVCTSGIAAGFVDINGNVPSASMDFNLKSMTPKKEGAYVDVSYQSLLQDDPSAEGIILDDIVKALDQAKDVAFWNGLSGNNEPVGILNTDGINEVTIPSGGPVLSTMLEFEKKIRDSFDYSADLKWVMATDMYYKLAATPYSAKEQNKMIVDPDTRKCIGYDVYMNASLPSGTIILGNFNEALEADFDGMTIRIVEDAQLARKQAIEIVAHRALDFLVRRPKSFTKNA